KRPNDAPTEPGPKRIELEDSFYEDLLQLNLKDDQLESWVDLGATDLTATEGMSQAEQQGKDMVFEIPDINPNDPL
ncbi:hypothetical protein KPH14_013022, partial [Odynerus spinipes]